MLEDGSPENLGELRVAVAEALVTDGTQSARALTSAYLRMLQTGVNLDALKYAPREYRDQLQDEIKEVRSMDRRLKTRAFKESYGRRSY